MLDKKNRNCCVYVHIMDGSVLLQTSLPSLSCSVQVLPPGSFQLDVWAMTDKEKLEFVPHIHEEGNKLFKQGKIQEATEKYYNGVACLKNLQMKVSASLRLLPDILVSVFHDQIDLQLFMTLSCLAFTSQEHPADEAWVKLDHMITPLLLNFCQCQLLQGQYYEVIEHCSSLLFKYEGEF